MRWFSRLAAVSVLLASTWLTAYQIGDAAEDSFEDLNRAAQIASSLGPNFSNPALPDDDADANIPNISHQSLLPASVSVSCRLRPTGLPEASFALLPSTALEIALRNLSPPRSAAAHERALALRQFRLAAARRTLAPPAA